MSQAKLKLPKAVSLAAERADAILIPTVEDQSDLAPDITEAVKSVAPVVTPEPAAPAEPKSPEKGSDYWEHRLKTVQGMHEADKRRLEEKLTQQTTELANLRKAFTAMEDATPREYDLRKYLSEAEIADYGEENLKVHLRAAVKAAREEMEQHFNDKFENAVTPVKEQIESIQQQAQEQKVAAFWDYLNTAVPNWEQINGDHDFLTWLVVEDEVTGVTPQEVLSAAEKTLDAKRIASIFKAYLQHAQNEQAAKQARLATQVQPSGLPGASPSGDANKGPVVTREFIRQFYSDMAKGVVYKNRPKEAADIEKRIQLAMKAGTIQ